MPYKGSEDLSIDLWGGLVLDMNPATLPSGASPDNQNIIYSETGPRTRPGLGTGVFPAITGNPTVNYLRTFVTINETLRALAQDSLGNLWKENPIGTLVSVYTGLQAGVIASSVTAYAREWMAMGDGKAGLDMPRQFDDANFDRVSQDGPGAAPTVIDETITQSIDASPSGLLSYSTLSIAASPNGLTENGNLCTCTVATAIWGLLRVGDSVQVAGATNIGYNGTWTVASIPAYNQITFYTSSPNLTASGAGTLQCTLFQANITSGIPYFTTDTTIGAGPYKLIVAGAGVAGYDGTWLCRDQIIISGVLILTLVGSTYGGAASGGGTVTTTGNVGSGVHKVSVLFVTRQGYLTRPAPPASWTTAGGNRAYVTGIPIGPPNVVKRILLFTGAAQSNFFYIPPGAPQTTLPGSAMVINDNTTTTTAVDFTDNILFAGTNVDALFDLHTLGECSGVIQYADRMFWWGERQKIDNFVNLSFDGGSSNNIPLGWTLDSTSGAGGSQDSLSALWGFDYLITGDGATAVRGKIYQSAYQDWLNVPIIQPNVAYSVRVRVKRNSTLAAGTLHITLTGDTGVAAGLAVTAAQATTAWQEFTAPLTLGSAIATPDSALTLNLYADGTPTNLGIFYVDDIEVYPTLQPVDNSLVRVSSAGNPESFISTTGFIQVSPSDDLAVRSGFLLRDNRLYLVKERGLYVTQDNGSSEPSGWEVDQVSSRVGTPCGRGVAVGEDWAVIVARDGLYIFWGPEPQKISQEIQPLWDTINWQYANTVWALVDIQERRIRIGVPTGSATKTWPPEPTTSPNMVAYLDFRDLDSAEEIAANPPVHISFTGRKIARDNARKWSQWPMTVNSCALIERTDGTVQVWCGNGLGNGKIYNEAQANLNDDGVAIDSYYWTAPLPSNDQEQMMQLGSQRKLFAYRTMYIEGSGTLLTYARPPSKFFTMNLPSLSLSDPATYDQGGIINIPGQERMCFGFGTNGANDWFRIARYAVNVKPDPMAPVRGF